MASLMSVNNNSDIAPLEDFDNEDIPEDIEENSLKNMDEILDISAQLDMMTSSLTENGIPSTPISGMYLDNCASTRNNLGISHSSVASLSKDETTSDFSRETKDKSPIKDAVAAENE